MKTIAIITGFALSVLSSSAFSLDYNDDIVKYFKTCYTAGVSVLANQQTEPATCQSLSDAPVPAGFSEIQVVSLDDSHKVVGKFNGVSVEYDGTAIQVIQHPKAIDGQRLLQRMMDRDRICVNQSSGSLYCCTWYGSGSPICG